MLGHTLGFRFCRTMNGGLPCHNILNCWFERFGVEAFIAENYSKEELQAIFKPPKMKIATMVEVLDKVIKPETAEGVDVTEKGNRNGEERG